MANSTAELGETLPSPPVTTVIILHSRTPIDLQGNSEPGDGAVSFSGVVKMISNSIAAEHKQHLGGNGFIIVGKEQNNDCHAIFMIGWTAKPPPEFTQTRAPEILHPILPLLRAPPDIAHMMFNPSIQGVRHDGSGSPGSRTPIVFDILKWTEVKATLDAALVSRHATARFVAGVQVYGSNGHAATGGCISAHQGTGSMRNADSDTGMPMQFLLVRWNSAEQACMEGATQADLNVLRSILWTQGTMWDAVLCRFDVYYPRLDD